MINVNSRLQYLITQHVNNQINREELNELYEWFQDREMESLLLTNIGKQQQNIKLLETSIPDQERIYQQLINTAGFSDTKKPRFFRLRQTYLLKGLAAAVLLMLGFGVAVHFVPLFNAKEKSISQAEKPIENVEKVDQGNHKAVLILSNGKKIAIADNNQNIEDGSSKLSFAEGQLKYSAHKASADNSGGLNTLIIPKGSNYQLVLCDGTKIWLNANSTLQYPTSFSSATREISLVGEAYLEVAHNATKPFILKSGKTAIKVLGTKFNVNSYNENLVKTTLLSGSVSIEKGTKKVVLKPGQEGTVGVNEQSIKVFDVDAEDAISWRNGYFIFHNQNIREVMNTIEQWYDIEIIYQGDVSARTFEGSVSRYKDVNRLLHNIELTGAIHFKIEGRNVTVMP